MDVPVPLVLTVAAIFVPTLCALLLELSQQRLYALVALGLAGIAVSWPPVGPHAPAGALPSRAVPAAHEQTFGRPPPRMRAALPAATQP